MLSILNYYRSSANQNDNKKSNPVWQDGHPNCLQTVHGGEPGDDGTPSCSLWTHTGNSPKESHRPERNISGELNLGFSYPRLGLCHEKPPLKMTHAPNVHCGGSSHCRDTDPRAGLLTEGILYTYMIYMVYIYIWYIYIKGYYSDLKPHFWNYEIRPTVPTRMGLGEKYT